MKKNIMMVGVGPHAKRIYFNYFKNHNICPKIIVDLESNEVEIKNYLKINGYVNTVLWLLLINIKIMEECHRNNIMNC